MLDSKKMNALTAVNSENAISIYIPTHRVDGIQQDLIRYKNALSETSNQLIAQGLDEGEVKKILRTAEAQLKEEEFWRHQSDALAIFIYDGTTEFFSLPIETDTQVWISNKLYLLPVVPLMTVSKGFYLLALSQNEVMVYEGTEFTLAELEKNEAFPENLAEILGYYDPNETVQHHAASGDNSIYHGQGAGKDVENARLEEYLRKIDEGIQQMACDDDKKPLVVYTTPSLIGIYRKVNKYPHLLENYIEGNPENINMMDLHEKAWMELIERFDAAEAEKMDAFEQNLADGKAAFNLLTVAPAAFAGQVDTLYLAAGEETWGTYDPSTHKIEVHTERQPNSQPLLNDIALAVSNQGGDVYILDRTNLPRPTSNVSASFRYVLQTV